jgi:putative FmdB family regulatory protein
MPTYLYECRNCGRFEKFQRITAEPLKECPECGEPVRRIIGAPGIIFKGSGFYSTDSRTNKTVKDNKDIAKEAVGNSTVNDNKPSTSKAEIAKEKVS